MCNNTVVNFPARNITSHIGALALASFLNNLIKDYADKYPYNIKNSNEFIKRIKDITLQPDTELICYDAEALFPSVPIADCLAALKVVMETNAEFTSKTKLTVNDAL